MPLMRPISNVLPGHNKTFIWHPLETIMTSEEDNVKEAFSKVKHDIYSLYSQITSLKRNMNLLNNEMTKVSEILNHFSNLIQDLALEKNKEKQAENQPKTPPTPITPSLAGIPTEGVLSPATPTHPSTTPTYLPTHFPYKNKEKGPFSSGNEGVPTDRQTIQQTDNSPLKEPIFTQKDEKTPSQYNNPIEDALKALESLDSLKKEIRLKFKQLTDQEVLIFSTLYQMEEEQGSVDYKALAVKLRLTESSIRDYVGRLLQKGIPVEKQRINNKKILLSISPGLKRVASLQTILHLRDL